jgi:hypothetical protein
MQDLSGPAIIEGTIDPNSKQVELIDTKTNTRTAATIDHTTNTFRAAVSQGHYTIRSGTAHTSLTALSAGQYKVDLRHASAVDFNLRSTAPSANEVTIELTAEGAGPHTFSLRAENLKLTEPASASLDLHTTGKQTLTWHAQILDPETPWVAVLLKDNSLEQHRDLTGIAAKTSTQAEATVR